MRRRPVNAGPDELQWKGNKMPNADGTATMVDVYNYFSDNRKNDYKLATFRTEWSELTDQDKSDLRMGIGNGSFTY